MELHELAVRQFRASAETQRVAVAARSGWIGGFPVDLAIATGGDNHRTGFDGQFHTVVDRDGAFAAAVLHDQVAHEALGSHRDARVVGDGGHQGALDLAAGGVPIGADHAGVAMAAFAAQQQCAAVAGTAVEARTELLQPGDRAVGAGNHLLHYAGIC